MQKTTGLDQFLPRWEQSRIYLRMISLHWQWSPPGQVWQTPSPPSLLSWTGSVSRSECWCPESDPSVSHLLWWWSLLSWHSHYWTWGLGTWFYKHLAESSTLQTRSLSIFTYIFIYSDSYEIVCVFTSSRAIAAHWTLVVNYWIFIFLILLINVLL